MPHGAALKATDAGQSKRVERTVIYANSWPTGGTILQLPPPWADLLLCDRRDFYGAAVGNAETVPVSALGESRRSKCSEWKEDVSRMSVRRATDNFNWSITFDMSLMKFN